MSPASERLVRWSGWANGTHQQILPAKVYLPTTSYHDEEVEKVYEEINNIIINSKAHYNIKIGDFNAKVIPSEIF